MLLNQRLIKSLDHINNFFLKTALTLFYIKFQKQRLKLSWVRHHQRSCNLINSFLISHCSIPVFCVWPIKAKLSSIKRRWAKASGRFPNHARDSQSRRMSRTTRLQRFMRTMCCPRKSPQAFTTAWTNSLMSWKRTMSVDPCQFREREQRSQRRMSRWTIKRRLSSRLQRLPVRFGKRQTFQVSEIISKMNRRCRKIARWRTSMCCRKRRRRAENQTRDTQRQAQGESRSIVYNRLWP